MSSGRSHTPLNGELRGHYNRLMFAVGVEFGLHAGYRDRDFWEERYPGTFEDGVIATKDGLPAVQEAVFNTLPYLSAAILLGKDAGIGIGPRAAFRWGKVDFPDAFVLTAHGGYSMLMPGVESSGRVRPFVDADFRAGLVMLRTGSLQSLGDAGLADGMIQPTFGLTAGVGTTF